MRTLLMTTMLLALALGSTQAAPLVELSAPALYDLQSVGFELERAASVEIEAVGRWSRNERGWNWSWGNSFWGNDDDEDVLSVYAWVIDSATRKPVWVMQARDTERFQGSRSLREIQEELELEAGRYEVYFYSGYGYLQDMDRWFDDDDRSRRRADRDREDLEEDLAQCFVRISSDEVSSVRSFEPDGGLEGALIRFTRLGDGALERQGFELTREMDLKVYALMEYPRGSDDAADFGWIVDTDRGERVWDMNDRRGRRAGGGDKNRLIDRDISLGPGRYVLSFGTDDSHSYEEFNTNPPYDPMNWGITLLPGPDFDRSAFRLIDAPTLGEPLVDFSRARDDDFFEQAFRLRRDADLHVVALGEGVDGGWTFVDYGWIADARTGETVWEMDDRNTTAAGGAEKNRMFDGAVQLPAGDYIAFYLTDDSHSWEDWNAGAPFEPEAWGMRIFAGDGASGSFELLSQEQIDQGTGVLVRLTRVGDHEREREDFTLDERTELEIYALGEGISGEMYDYGWIRNRDTRRTVWEMRYRDTEHAGGASKNRMIRETVVLDPGEYEVIYETDGSHSFEGWNDRRPDDPLSWGITIRKR